MEKKIMIAIDNSIPSKHAVNYAVAMTKMIRPLTLTLYHVQPPISQYLQDEAKKDRKASAQLEAVLQKNAQAAQDLLTEIKESAIRKGVGNKHIEIETRQRRIEVDRAILAAAEEKRCDALVVGSRDLSSLQKAFMDSVSTRILQQPAAVPIWLIKGKVEKPGKFLVAVDGSQNAYRAVDHLAFMLSGNPDASISFIHVKPKLKDVCAINFEDAGTDHLESVIDQSNRQCMEDFFQQVLARLKEAGIGEDRIEINVVEKVFRIDKAILETTEQKNYGTVVMGRRGMNRTFFTGSVSTNLMERMSNRALWIIQ